MKDLIFLSIVAILTVFLLAAPGNILAGDKYQKYHECHKQYREFVWAKFMKCIEV